MCLTISPLFWNDFSVLKKISSGRSETFLKFSRKDFSCLNNSNLLAWDVGLIGYFSKSKIPKSIRQINQGNIELILGLGYNIFHSNNYI